LDVLNVITTLISNVGFPIAAFVMMWYQNLKTSKVLSELKETVSQNTIAIEQLKEKIK